uniref:Uncharacterized protein n=1 Tax=Amphimedon queenslandica TaxID=400682 RepID=A0A1X7U2N3_AMPQE
MNLYLAKKWQPFLYITPSAVLVLLWNFLMYAHYVLISRFIGGSSKEVAPASWYKYADVWIGRHKAILIGIFSGFSSFTANIIQYNIDQLVGASADELNSVIYWHILSEPLVLFLFYLLQCLFYGTSGVSVSLVLVSHSILKHKLENISLIKNPIKLIVRVLCYARKHKYPENRSALTYWEEEAPSRLDLGKDKYGGPFTEEEVEDVKTIFRMLPLFIGFFAFILYDDSYWSTIDSFTLPTCLAVTDSLYHICSVILIVCFYKYIPISKVIIFVIKKPNADINNFAKLLFIPQTIQAFSYILVYPVSLEFTVAQSPVHMRGVMVGLWYTSWAIVFVILAKRYKYRVRENEVNIVQIVDDHYQRYINQREQFMSDIDNDSSNYRLRHIDIYIMSTLRAYIGRKWQPFIHISPPAVLVLFWNFLIYTHYFLLSHFTGIFATEVAPATWYKYGLIYNIDQLVGASADELTSIIYWHILSEPLVALIFYLLQCLFYSTSGVSVSLVLVSHSFLKHKLENISLIKNPIKLIVRVLCYARKHKYPKNRSALTYWEKEAPSRLDLGKNKYGGPFTEEEVEDVKTVFRMLPLFIGIIAHSLSIDAYWTAISLEFTVAQSPVHMRGVMVGLWYTSWAVGYLISIGTKIPFDCESQYICTSFYYYVTKSVLVLIILIVFVILAKRYKYRVRENEINIVQIVDDHYQSVLTVVSNMLAVSLVDLQKK